MQCAPGATAYDARMGTPGLRSTDRILTTHVGSLVRPDDLVAALQARRGGREGALGEDEFDAVLLGASERSCCARPRSASTS